jgi:hypothetical protein
VTSIRLLPGSGALQLCGFFSAATRSGSGSTAGSSTGGASSPRHLSNGRVIENSQRSSVHSPLTRFGSGPVNRPDADTPKNVFPLYLTLTSRSKSMMKPASLSKSASKLRRASTLSPAPPTLKSRSAPNCFVFEVSAK